MTLEEWRNQLIDRCEMSPCDIPEMEKIISEIIAAERDRCAKIADSHCCVNDTELAGADNFCSCDHKIAAMIRESRKA